MAHAIASSSCPGSSEAATSPAPTCTKGARRAASAAAARSAAHALRTEGGVSGTGRRESGLRSRKFQWKLADAGKGGGVRASSRSRSSS
eukprot:13547203-Alexandrium_andersonii.AAC.1